MVAERYPRGSSSLAGEVSATLRATQGLAGDSTTSREKSNTIAQESSAKFKATNSGAQFSGTDCQISQAVLRDNPALSPNSTLFNHSPSALSSPYTSRPDTPERQSVDNKLPSRQTTENQLDSDTVPPITEMPHPIGINSEVGDGKDERNVEETSTSDEEVCSTEIVPASEKQGVAIVSSASAQLSPKVSSAKRSKSRRVKEDQFKKLVVIPSYLSEQMVSAIGSYGVVSDPVDAMDVEPPACPLLVFINSKSGGRLGPELEHLLINLIGSSQVYDLSKEKPSDVLQYGLGCLEKLAIAGDPCARVTRNRMRIMVAGGDGTVGWVLGCVAELGIHGTDFEIPPVGVIPLGTGNDLSRSFHWGTGLASATRSAVRRCLRRATQATQVPLDRWQVFVQPAPTLAGTQLQLPHAFHPQQHVPLEGPGSEVTPRFEGLFWNYFSVGMDAQVAYGFHHLRDQKPWLARGRVANQMIYSGYGCVQGWFCTPCTASPHARGLRHIVKLHIQRGHDTTADWEEVTIPAGMRALIILNLQSYAGGRNPWGRPNTEQRNKKGLKKPSVCDGLLEVLCLKDGWHTAFVMISMVNAVRLCQATAVRLELCGERNEAYMQLDGEPWQQPVSREDEQPTVVEILRADLPSMMLVRN